MNQRLISRAWVQAAIVLALSAVLYWPLLGTPGFGLSEGHRVVPAWTMLQTGEWLKIEMFGATYLRKPPGFPWAIAASSMLFGQTEFAARAVSAASCTLMPLVAWWFARRWFGRPGGWEPLGAGVAQAMMPQFVSIGRLAEIDAFNAMGTQLACFGLIELMRTAPMARGGIGVGEIRSRAVVAAATTLGIVVAGLAKGPASLTCLLGVLIAGAWIVGWRRALLGRWVLVSLLVAGSSLGLLGWMILRANPADGAVVQDFSEFTWSLDRLVGTLALLPSSAIAALPASLTLLPIAALARMRARPLHFDRSIDAPGSASIADPLPLLAFWLASAWVISVALLMIAGISNPRYAMPAAVLIPPLVTLALRLGGNSENPSPNAAPPATPSRLTRDLARWSYMHHPLVIPCVLLPIILAWGVYRETYRDRREHGRLAGEALGTAIAHRADLPAGAIVWANDLVEARPDVLLYMQRAAECARSKRFSLTRVPSDGHGNVLVRWARDPMRRGELPQPDQTHGAMHDAWPDVPACFLLLRRDPQSKELQTYAPWIDAPPSATGATPVPSDESPKRPRLILRATGRAASYDFVLYEVVYPDPLSRTP